MQQVFHIFVKYLTEKLAVYSSHPLLFCNVLRKIFYKYLISDQLCSVIATISEKKKNFILVQCLHCG